MIDVLVMILAGGRGERLYPLTRDRAKPAVPFGGRYRIIDFALSNFINSGFFRIKVLTQYRSNSLLIHLARGFNFGSLAEHYVDADPGRTRASARSAGTSAPPTPSTRTSASCTTSCRRTSRSSAATTSTRWTSAR